MPNSVKRLRPKRPSWGVIDIGSNSVRLVIYDGPAEAPLSIHNEKVLCGLGERDLKTGALREEAMSDALAALRRYKGILDATQPEQLIVFATAAARDASNGPAFLEAIAALGLEVQLLPGQEEARLAALGVLASAPEILGLPGGGMAGDLGGGSLELCHISGEHDGFLGPRVSLPIGGLRLASLFKGNPTGAKKYINQCLDDVPWLSNCPARSLYIVGGAWRALARIGMNETGYPLDILDHYAMTRREVAQLCDRVSNAPIMDLEEMPWVQRRRAPTLPFAAMVLRAVFDRLSGERVIVSSSGVREGIIFDRLLPEQKVDDPLPVLATYIAGTGGGALSADVDAVAQFLEPVLAEDFINHRRLWDAAITLSQVSLSHHPEMRAAQAAQMVMGLPLRGVSHRERAMIAIALFYRHGGTSSDLYKVVPLSLVDDEHKAEAQQVGLALRLALEFDPNGRGVLRRAKLVVDQDTLRLDLAPEDRAMWGRGPERRLERFAASLGKRAAV